VTSCQGRLEENYPKGNFGSAAVAGAKYLKDIRTDVFLCSLSVAYRRFPEGNLLQFTLPCGNGKQVETIDIVSPINHRFPAMINYHKNVMKNNDFYRANFSTPHHALRLNDAGSFIRNPASASP